VPWRRFVFAPLMIHFECDLHIWLTFCSWNRLMTSHTQTRIVSFVLWFIGEKNFQSQMNSINFPSCWHFVTHIMSEDKWCMLRSDAINRFDTLPPTTATERIIKRKVLNIHSWNKATSWSCFHAHDFQVVGLVMVHDDTLKLNWLTALSSFKKMIGRKCHKSSQSIVFVFKYRDKIEDLESMRFCSRFRSIVFAYECQMENSTNFCLIVLKCHEDLVQLMAINSAIESLTRQKWLDGFASTPGSLDTSQRSNDPQLTLKTNWKS
jgi:hypothetical protein